MEQKYRARGVLSTQDTMQALENNKGETEWKIIHL